VQASSGPFCPNCGAQNPISAAFCGACGESLPQREDIASLWGQAPASTSIRSRATTLDRSLQDTQVITPSSSTEQTWTVKPTAPKPAAESWEIKAPEQVEQHPKRTSGTLLGVIALLLMCVVLGVFGWYAGLPIARDQLETQVTEAVSRQVASINDLPLRTTGEIVLTEEELNQSLEANEKAYEPIENAKVTLDDGLITITVDALGTSSTYTANATIDDGKLVVVDPQVSGPAGQVLSADELATIIEGQFAALMNRFDRTPTAIRIRDGSISVATQPR
jgi:zinc-ribbon domain